MKHTRLTDYPEEDNIQAEQVESFLGLPSTGELILFGALAVGVIALLAYEGTKSAVNFVGDHPELIKYAAMAAA